MNQDKKILQDISKIASAAFSCAVTMKRGAASYVKEELSKFFSKMNLVKRDEFEAQSKIIMQTKNRLDHIVEDIKSDLKDNKNKLKSKPTVKKSKTSVEKSPKAKAKPKLVTKSVKNPAPEANKTKKTAPKPTKKASKK